YIPIFIMIFINKMERLNFASIFKTIQGNFNFWILIIFISGICLIIISDFLSQIEKSTLNNTKPIKVELHELKLNEYEIINYFITYLIPILTLDPSRWTSILSNGILIILVGIYFVRNNLLSFNIMFLIMNYRIYKDKNENIYISKHTYNKATSKNLIAFQYDESNIYYLTVQNKLHKNDNKTTIDKGQMKY
ncbi:hypothetical protein, partial [Staphylococcus pseudintermedius]